MVRLHLLALRFLAIKKRWNAGSDDMIKTLIAGIAAATLLGSVVYVLAAGTEVMASTSQPAVKGDLFEIRWSGIVCQRAWPYYDSSCLRDPSRPGSRARTVRVVSADRLTAMKPAALAAK
jgi:hypothetical protein